MTLWEQYNPDRLLGSVLTDVCGMPLAPCGEKALYEALKRHLTRKELRCWVMEEGGAARETIMDAAGLDTQGAERTLEKARKKLHQPKLQAELRRLLASTEDSGE